MIFETDHLDCYRLCVIQRDDSKLYRITVETKRAKACRNSNLFPTNDYNFFDAHKLAITETIDMMVRDILYWNNNFNKELSREFKIERTALECVFFFG